MNAGERLVRRLTGLLPILVIAALFAAPLAIWLVKRDAPIIQETRMRGRLIGAGQPATSVKVRLEDGAEVVATAPPEALASGLTDGAEVTVLRRTAPDGTEELVIER